MIEIVQVARPAQVEEARRLFLEYAESLGFSLCFQSFDQELAGLPGDYAPPPGRLLLAYDGGRAVGCVALHASGGDGTCEMKRLYVQPAARGRGAGKALLDAVVAEARAIGYRRMRLDTVEPRMKAAVAMYRSYGFREIPPYRENPMPGTLYMELDLEKSPRAQV